MKVVLYAPRPYSKSRPSHGAPLALLAISSLLAKEGHNATIISDNLYKDPTGETLESCEGAVCLGITAMTGYQITDGLEIARLVKTRYPKLPIVWGGRHPTLEPTGTMECPYVDVIVRGQGEKTFTELAHALEEGKSLANIAGISYKVNGKILHNVDRPLEDPNSFPPMPYFLIDIEKAIYHRAGSTRTLNYISSMGCPYRCGFCSEQTVCKRKWLGLKGSRVAREISQLVRDYGIDTIEFQDPNLLVNVNRVRTFCEEFIRRNLKITWVGGGFRVGTLLKLEKETWDLMVRSGCKDFMVGAESGYQPALDLMQKDLQIEETLALARKLQHEPAGINWFMVCGLPWDPNPTKTKKLVDLEIRYSLNLVRKICSLNSYNRPIFKVFVPYPGCPLYERSLAAGFNPPGSFEGWGNLNSIPRPTPWVNPEQARILGMLNHIFTILDPSFQEWLESFISNKILRLLLKVAFGVYRPIIRFRIKHQFFTLFIGYWIYTIVRRKQSFI